MLVGINGWQGGTCGRVRRLGILAIGILVLLVGAGELWSQEAVRRAPARTGMVLDEDGVSRPPTPEDALRVLREGSIDPALAVLRQVFEPRSPEELDRFASDLGEIILTTNPADEDRIAFEARMGLLLAALQYEGGRGTPYAGAYDQLVRVYETLVARALENGGTDPFKEMHRLDEAEPGGRPRYAQLSGVLSSIFAADPERRGADYVVALIEGAEPPELEEYSAPAPTLWCNAADALYQNGEGRLTLMREVAGDEKFILSRCNQLGWRSVFYE